MRTRKTLECSYSENVTEALKLGYLLTGDRQVAEDLTQEAFLRVFGRFQELRREDAFKAYLRRTIVNLSKDYFRRLARERAYIATERGLVREHVVHGVGIEVSDELLRGLRAIPTRQRTAIVLRYCLALSERETAEVLRTSTGAVKSLTARGLTKLRDTIGGAADE